MSEKEVTEDAINKKLDEIMEQHEDKTIRFLAKILFNCRFDLNELKLELIKCLGDIGIEVDVNHKPEEEDGRFYS